MRSKRERMLFAVCLAVLLSLPALAFAGSAEVLPKGVSRLSVDYSFYQPVTDRFGPGGDKESVAADFNATLDAGIFPGLIPEGANIGDSIVKFEYEFRDLILDYQYGLSDKVSLGVRIPYYWNKTSLKEARVDTSGATQEVLDALTGGGFEAGDPVTDAIVTEFVLGSLESPPFSFEPFESWDKSGLSDIEASLRYQYFRNECWRLALTGGVRLPTGKTDDPDNLLDTEFGTGAMALLLRFHQDYIRVRDLLLNFTVKYDLVLPDKETVRVLDDVDQPLAPEANKEKVDRDLGDLLAFEFYAGLSLSETWSVSGLYTIASRQEDDIDGDLGLAYESLEDETDWDYQSFTAGVMYSTVNRYLEEKANIPLDVGLSYEIVFDGSNNYLEQRLITLGMALYF